MLAQSSRLCTLSNVEIKEPAWPLTHIERDETKWSVCDVSLTVVWRPLKSRTLCSFKHDSHFDIEKERSSDFILQTIRIAEAVVPSKTSTGI